MTAAHSHYALGMSGRNKQVQERNTLPAITPTSQTPAEVEF
jgi:hypothetical protein